MSAKFLQHIGFFLILWGVVYFFYGLAIQSSHSGTLYYRFNLPPRLSSSIYRYPPELYRYPDLRELRTNPNGKNAKRPHPPWLEV